MLPKREKPFGLCSVCGHCTRNIEHISARCSQEKQGERCSGMYWTRLGHNDWTECPQCQGTGCEDGPKCVACTGEGWRGRKSR